MVRGLRSPRLMQTNGSALLTARLSAWVRVTSIRGDTRTLSLVDCRDCIALASIDRGLFALYDAVPNCFRLMCILVLLTSAVAVKPPQARDVSARSVTVIDYGAS